MRIAERRIRTGDVLRAGTGPPRSGNRCGWRPIGVLGTMGAWPAGLHRPGSTRVPFSGPAVGSYMSQTHMGIQVRDGGAILSPSVPRDLPDTDDVSALLAAIRRAEHAIRDRRSRHARMGLPSKF